MWIYVKAAQDSKAERRSRLRSKLKCVSISKFSPLGENLAPPLLLGNH